MSDGKIPNSFRYSEELLAAYGQTSLDNALSLIEEAELLLSQEKLARAYFIAVAAIEEIGKSFIAFDALGRNLNDSAVTAKIRLSFESHSKKISSAFCASVINQNGSKGEIMTSVDLMIDLKNGREPSMYTDIDYSTGEIQTPQKAISPKAAEDCVRLATHCYLKNVEHRKNKPPISRSKAEDHFYGMKDGKIQELLNLEDFWWFYLSRMESGNNGFAEAIAIYQKDYLSKNRKYKSTPI